jgi:hypothetical protein
MTTRAQRFGVVNLTASSHEDDDATRVRRAEERIEELLANPDYRWASDTLHGIYDTIQRSGRVSDRQWTAIVNIERRGR